MQGQLSVLQRQMDAKLAAMRSMAQHSALRQVRGAGLPKQKRQHLVRAFCRGAVGCAATETPASPSPLPHPPACACTRSRPLTCPLTRPTTPSSPSCSARRTRWTASGLSCCASWRSSSTPGVSCHGGGCTSGWLGLLAGSYVRSLVPLLVNPMRPACCLQRTSVWRCARSTRPASASWTSACGRCTPRCATPAVLGRAGGPAGLEVLLCVSHRVSHTRLSLAPAPTLCDRPLFLFTIRRRSGRWSWSA